MIAYLKKDKYFGGIVPLIEPQHGKTDKFRINQLDKFNCITSVYTNLN